MSERTQHKRNLRQRKLDQQARLEQGHANELEKDPALESTVALAMVGMPTYVALLNEKPKTKKGGWRRSSLNKDREQSTKESRHSESTEATLDAPTETQSSTNDAAAIDPITGLAIVGTAAYTKLSKKNKGKAKVLAGMATVLAITSACTSERVYELQHPDPEESDQNTLLVKENQSQNPLDSYPLTAPQAAPTKESITVSEIENAVAETVEAEQASTNTTSSQTENQELSPSQARFFVEDASAIGGMSIPVEDQPKFQQDLVELAAKGVIGGGYLLPRYGLDGETRYFIDKDNITDLDSVYGHGTSTIIVMDDTLQDGYYTLSEYEFEEAGIEVDLLSVDEQGRGAGYDEGNMVGVRQPETDPETELVRSNLVPISQEASEPTEEAEEVVEEVEHQTPMDVIYGIANFSERGEVASESGGLTIHWSDEVLDEAGYASVNIDPKKMDEMHNLILENVYKEADQLRDSEVVLSITGRIQGKVNGIDNYSVTPEQYSSIIDNDTGVLYDLVGVSNIVRFEYRGAEGAIVDQIAFFNEAGRIVIVRSSIVNAPKYKNHQDNFKLYGDGIASVNGFLGYAADGIEVPSARPIYTKLGCNIDLEDATNYCSTDGGHLTIEHVE